LGAIAALFVLPLAATAWAVPAPAPTLEQVQQKMAGLAVPFEANQGQFAPEVAFAARTFAGTLFITRDGKIVHALAGKPQQKEEAKQGKEAQQNNEVTPVDHTPSDRTGMDRTPRGPGWSLVESLLGAGELTPAGSQPSATRVSRFSGSATPNQHSSIATFDRVRLGEAWPGVSVELAARGNNVEKLFTVAPGTNPKTIRMGIAGAKRLRVGTDGSLIATTGNGDVAFTPPVAFQFNVTVDWNVRYQTVDGFGASDAFVNIALTDAQADMFFSADTGIGLSFLRMGIANGGGLNGGAFSDATKAAARGARVWAAAWTAPGA